MFDPNSTRPFRVSRSKIELFIQCHLCFYLNQRHGIWTPDSPPFVLNIRIDQLIKKDANHLRKSQTPDHRAEEFGVHAVPFNHPEMKFWMDTRCGLEELHQETNLTVFGAVDDVWLVNNEKLSVIDEKATHSNHKITESAFWDQYKRQIELYSWLLSRQGLYYPVSEVGYFVRFNTDKSQDSFKSDSLEFEYEVIPHTCNNGWIEPTLIAIKECLMRDTAPEPSETCKWCEYRTAAAAAQTKIRA